jgi:hypothetical protein
MPYLHCIKNLEEKEATSARLPSGPPVGRPAGRCSPKAGATPVGRVVLVESMSGTRIQGQILAATHVPVASGLKAGCWYWIADPATDRWVHESLIVSTGPKTENSRERA